MVSIQRICVISFSLAAVALVDGQDAPAAPDLIRHYQPLHVTAGERGSVVAGIRTEPRPVLAAGHPALFYDDISLTEGGESGCLYKLKKKVKAKGGCQTCPEKGDLIESGKDCDPDKKLKKECAKKFKPKGKKIPCPDGEKGFCKKIVGVRDSCAG